MFQVFGFYCFGTVGNVLLCQGLPCGMTWVCGYQTSGKEARHMLGAQNPLVQFSFCCWRGLQ